MSDNNFKGTAKKLEGSVEAGFGAATGDRSTQFKGEAKRYGGEAQNALGNVQDKVESISGRVRGFIDSASEDFSQVTSKVNQEIHDKPLRSSFIALGVGFLIGALISR